MEKQKRGAHNPSQGLLLFAAGVIVIALVGVWLVSSFTPSEVKEDVAQTSADILIEDTPCATTVEEAANLYGVPRFGEWNVGRNGTFVLLISEETYGANWDLTIPRGHHLEIRIIQSEDNPEPAYWHINYVISLNGPITLEQYSDAQSIGTESTNYRLEVTCSS